MNQDQFASRELCERLQKMGCVSESGFFYVKEFDCGPYYRSELIPSFLIPERGLTIPAFAQNDFTGATEQADENCKIIWPGFFTNSAEMAAKTLGYSPPSYFAWYNRKHGILDLNKERDNWWQYIERTMEGL